LHLVLDKDKWLSGEEGNTGVDDPPKSSTTEGKNVQLVVAGEKRSSGDKGSGDKGISADEAAPES
jgi:hypothetical protein